MSKEAKDIVKSFYETDLINSLESISEFLHSDIELSWVSSFGFSKKNFQEIVEMFSAMKKSYNTLACKINEVISEDNKVSVHYTYFGSLIESPDKVVTIAHFMAIWEIKEGKLYKGYQISQHGNNGPDDLTMV